MWTSLVLRQNKKGAPTSCAKFRVLAIKPENSTINRLENLLNLGVTPYTNKIIAEYIWIGGTGIDLCSKSRTIPRPVEHPSELPKWNYDGSSTGQASVLKQFSKILSMAVTIFWLFAIPTRQQASLSLQTSAAEIFSRPKVRNRTRVHLTSIKCEMAFRLARWRLSWSTGINISGTNGEVMPGQWEYQVGPSAGIEAGDHIWCSRYILERIPEQAGVVLSLDPKPIEGDWNGAGCQTNFRVWLTVVAQSVWEETHRSMAKVTWKTGAQL